MNRSAATLSALCAAAESGALWPQLGDTSFISLESSSPMGDNNPESGALVCDDAMCASCMGAPCYDKAYDGNYELTCVCPITGFGAQCSFARVEDRADGHLCKEVSSDEASCAASVGATEDANITKTWATIDQYVSAIVTASPDQGNATQCPSTAVDSGKYEANSSSYVAPRNGTGRR